MRVTKGGLEQCRTENMSKTLVGEILVYIAGMSSSKSIEGDTCDNTGQEDGGAFV